MSMVSEKEIREYCTLPTFIVKNPGRSLPFYTNWSKERLDKHNKDYAFSTDSPNYMDYRELTESERQQWRPLISDFVKYTETALDANTQPINIVPYGQLGASYYLRLDKTIYTPLPSDEPSDVLCMKVEDYICNVVEDFLIIPPYGRALGRSMESVCLAANVQMVGYGHQFYGDAGGIVTVQNLKNREQGKVEINIFNASSRPLKIYIGQGIGYVHFFTHNDK